MKKLILAVLLFGSHAVLAGNILTRDGTLYRNVTIISADPERILIVHDGGGCQIQYADLAEGALSVKQRNTVEEKLKEYIARKARLEQLKLEKEAFEQEQLAKGLILFEGNWMKPADRQDLLARRALAKLEKERLAVELEKQKAELRKAQVLEQQERQRLEEYRNSRRSYSYYYSYPSYRTSRNCRYPVYYGKSSHKCSGSCCRSNQRYSGSSGVSLYKSGHSISYKSGSSSYSHSISRPQKSSSGRSADCRTR
jgi:hypothetical protein